jgi:tRNA nucleotidyltransferase (CCA-adding enzyme)
MKTAYWEHFSHEADIGIRGIADTLPCVFEQVALALTGVLTDPEIVEQQQQIDISCVAPDIELLLVDWLNALIYEMATRRMLFSRFEVHLEDHHLYAKVWGEGIDIGKHEPAVEVKGATYTELDVHQEDGRWIAQCVVDV